jgi:DNA polymerase-3 subunit delta
MHAAAFLKSADETEIGPIAVLHGTDRFLMQSSLNAVARRVLGDEEDQSLGLTKFDGKSVELKTVCDELLTVSMWGDARLVAIDDADTFVTQNRAALERFLEHPPKKSVLALLVKSWPKNTRLAKLTAKIGLDLECTELQGAALVKWLVDLCRDKHGKQLGRDAASLIVELAGSELGLLNQEVEKLVAYVGDRAKIEFDDVERLVGGWRAETTWVLVNAVRDGDLPTALVNLDKLLASGEAPQRILGGINFVFRKLAVATELARQGLPLNAALTKAGCFPRDVQGSATYLRRLGRAKAERLFTTLLEADGDMKGASRLSERVQLERLLVTLSGRA